jgi:exoribonuclease-2
MQTAPCRHEGLGVENYAWCTSPLRRYSDLVNQWQLIALAKHGVTAKLAAPFAPKDSELFAIAADFDTTYGAYGEYQNLLEKYWCLRWVAQQTLPVKARVRTLKEGQVRLELVPLRLHIPELAEKPRGIEVDIEIIEIDLLELSASVRVIEIFEPLNSATDIAD